MNESIYAILGNDLANTATTVGSALGLSFEELIKNAVRSYINPCLNNEGKADYKDGIYLKGKQELLVKAAENEGREVVVEKIPCKIIEKCRIYGEDYYSLICNGNIMKVPASNVNVFN